MSGAAEEPGMRWEGGDKEWGRGVHRAGINPSGCRESLKDSKEVRKGKKLNLLGWTVWWETEMVRLAATVNQ